MARASFTTLPLEIKARIAEIASEQEDAWAARVADPVQLASHINCLSALALVNKELRDLAAKHQFTVLHVRKVLLSVFRFRILPRYGHHITEIVLFGSGHLQEAELVLTLMSQMPALRVLRLDQWTAVTLFGPGVTLRPDLEDTVASDRASVLLLNAPKIEALTLLYFEPSEAVALITACVNVTSLGIINFAVSPHEEQLQDVTTAIASLSHLQSLTVEADEGVEGNWPIEAFAPLARNPPPLATLELRKFPLDHTTLHLITIFASTVDALILEIEPQDPPADLTSLDAIQLPRLTCLELVALQPQLAEIIRLLTTASTLSLFSHFSSPHGAVGPTDPTLLALVKAQPSLRSLWLWDVNLELVGDEESPSTVLPSPSFLAAYADLVQAHPDIDQNMLDQHHLTPFHPNANLDYTEKEAKFLAGTLRRTLEFGLVELDRIEAEGNVAKAVRWVPKLKALEEERMAWDD